MSTTEQQARLETFFRERTGDPGCVIAAYEPITGGYSRLMARVWVESGSGRVGYVVRSDPPPGHSILDTDRAAEWALLSALHGSAAVPLPAPLWFDAGGAELGSPTIVSEMIEGQSLYATVLAGGGSDPSLTHRLCDLLAGVHTCDITGLPPDLARPESWDGYIEGRIQRWVDAERSHVDRDPFMRYIASWLRANRPAPAPLGLVHGDFQAPNVLVDPAGRFLLVDWELAHIGDPREDLGWWALAHTTQPPDIIAADEAAFLARYRERTGLTEEQVNPATVAWFTLLASEAVFISVIQQFAKVATGETTAMGVTYMSNAIAAMHDVFIHAMDRHATVGGAA